MISERLIVGPDGARRRLTEVLSNAQASIRIIDHRLTDPQILALLDDKRREGLSVQVLGSGSMGALICHGRMIMADKKTAIIGSIHLSPPSLNLRREVAIVVEEPSLVAELYDYFENLAMNEANRMNVWTAPPLPPEDEDDEEDE
jgi:phosphatidylserine/phosphatidylglycerophosphate/cardiolipin synthase-like enzyme